MKIKTLLITAAALAAGVITSQAQVYSQNIVGYVNTYTTGFIPLSTPLDVVSADGASTNSVTNILVNVFNSGIGAGPLDNSQLYTYTGTHYVINDFDSNPQDAADNSQTFTGITDLGGNFVPAPNLGNGTGYFLKFSPVTGYPSTLTNTVVGSVRGVYSGYISNTVTIGTAHINSLTGSGLPIGGKLLTGMGLTNLLAQGLLDGNGIQIPNIVGGALHGFTVYEFDSNPQDAADNSQPFTGITDTGGNFVTEPTLPVGTSFFFVNQTATITPWVQVISQ